MVVLLFIFLMVIGYLFGSLCSAIIVSRLFSLPDPCIEGSKNPGTTNVLRLAGKKYALMVLLGDILKGLIPVVIAKMLGASPAVVGFTGLAAVMGHMYPIFFNFKGGKGVATALGALLGINVILGSMVIGTWLIVANFTRYASMASMVSLTLAPLYALFVMNRLDILSPLFLITLFVLYQHRNNITRLMDGDEPKITLSHNLNEELSAVLTETVKEEQIDAEEEIKESADLPPRTKKATTKKPAVKTTKKTVQKVKTKKQV